MDISKELVRNAVLSISDTMTLNFASNKLPKGFRYFGVANYTD